GGPGTGARRVRRPGRRAALAGHPRAAGRVRRGRRAAAALAGPRPRRRPRRRRLLRPPRRQPVPGGVVTRRRIAVRPAAALGELERLLGALAAAFPVDFVAWSEGLDHDGVLALGP